MDKYHGTLLVLCAASGTGKTTLATMLCENFPALTFSVSCTTRAPRIGEVDGKEYFFMDETEFIKCKDSGYFAEWAKVHDNYYGTPKKNLLSVLEKGKDVLFDIDVQGAAQIKQSIPESCLVFILPPSFDALCKRLQKRKQDSTQVIARRLTNAKEEILKATQCDYWIVNDDLEQAYKDLCSIYLSQKLRPYSRPGLLQAALSTAEEE